MKIILDTNAFISGIFWSGSPHKVLSLWAQNKINLLVTKKILSEYFRVLHRIGHNGDIARKWGAFVLENSILLQDKTFVKVCRDTGADYTLISQYDAQLLGITYKAIK